MKKIFLTFASLVVACVAFGQTDSTQVTTMSDILREQEEASTRLFAGDHLNKIWGYRTYLDISYVNSKLKPKADIPTSLKDASGKDVLVPDYKSEWGMSLKWGRSYRLHKQAIARCLQFSLDYTWIDLNLNGYDTKLTDGIDTDSQGNTGKKIAYDSRNYIVDEETGDYVFYVPYNMKKYEVSYGMAVGPSINIAPLVYAKAQDLHYLQLHAYWHIGYGVSGMYIGEDKKYDQNQAIAKTDATGTTTVTGGTQEDAECRRMAAENCLRWGHGLTNTIGLGISWKFIGLGWEYRTSTLKYKSIGHNFDEDSHKFTQSNSRVYLQFRF